VNHRERRAALSDDVFTELVAFEILTCSNIKAEEGILNMVSRYSLHWALRNQLRKAFEEDVEQPKPGHLILCWDHQEQPCLSHSFHYVVEIDAMNSLHVIHLCFN